MRAAVHNGITMFSGSAGVQANAAPLSGRYNFPARGKEEILRDIAAETGHTNEQAAPTELEDPAEKVDGERRDNGQHDGPMSWVL